MAVVELVNNDDEDCVVMYEKMVHIPFGDGLLLPKENLHSGHYGSRGCLRLHGIISTHKWSATHLGMVKNYIEGEFGKKYTRLPLELGNKYDITNLCPLCFRNVENKNRVEHHKKCALRSGSDIGMHLASCK